MLAAAHTCVLCYACDFSYVSSVSDCSPPVDGLDAMVRSLNDSNSLTAFVRGMRKEWCKMV